MESKYKKEYHEKAVALVKKMSLEEKVSLTLQDSPRMEKLGIPAYHWWNEALHGVARAGTATILPQAIGLAASFDEELVHQAGDLIATEGRAKYNAQSEYGDRDIYKGLTFWAPNINIFRDPRWGRGHETYGEDPFLTSRMGIQFIKGMQGDDPRYYKAAACVKHFAVHSGPEDIRHEFNAVASARDMEETYLYAFKKCVQEADVEGVMGAYNRTNGVPCCANPELLQKKLRKEWGFDGYITSDFGALKDIHGGHHVTGNATESAALAMNNGCDLNSGRVYEHLTEAVKKGMVPEARLDEAVATLLSTRMRLGILGTTGKTAYDTISFLENDSRAHAEFSKKAAWKTAVLLKNEKQVLPLQKEKIHTIGVIGPNADNRRALVGNYEGTASEYVTVLDGIRRYAGEECRVLYAQGCHLYKSRVESLARDNDRLAEARAVCAESDVVVVVLGLDAGLEGEEGDAGNAYASGDKQSLQLPGNQEAVLKAAADSGKPVVLVVLSGSALDLSYAQDNVPAILQAWYPGEQGGCAVAELLFGEHSPEGKLPVTFYRDLSGLPDFTDYSMQGRTYRYLTEEPLYPFGYGLTYGEFHLQEVKLDRTEVSRDQPVRILATVENTGRMAAGNCVEVYVQSLHRGAPHAQLKGFRKVFLQPGEQTKVEIELSPESFCLYDEEGKCRLYPDDCVLYVGFHQPDARSAALDPTAVWERKMSVNA